MSGGLVVLEHRRGGAYNRNVVGSARRWTAVAAAAGRAIGPLSAPIWKRAR